MYLTSQERAVPILSEAEILQHGTKKVGFPPPPVVASSYTRNLLFIHSIHAPFSSLMALTSAWIATEYTHF